MKTIIVSFLAVFGLLFLPLIARAQNDAKTLDEVKTVETNWPGIHYQITIIKRIPPARLLVVIRVFATPDAPAQGTLLGFPVPIPTGMSRSEAALLYPPRPLSFLQSVMTDEATQQKFPALPSVAPPGRAYRSSTILQNLMPQHNILATVQFAAPPPPPGPTTVAPAKQTVSFLLPNTKVQITHVPIPPPVVATTTN